MNPGSGFEKGLCQLSADRKKAAGVQVSVKKWSTFSVNQSGSLVFLTATGRETSVLDHKYDRPLIEFVSDTEAAVFNLACVCRKLGAGGGFSF